MSLRRAVRVSSVALTVSLVVLLCRTSGATEASPPIIQKPFGASTIPLNGSTSLTFTITNLNAITLTGIAFTDTLPSGLAVSMPNGLTGSCGGGTITATPNSGTVSLSGAVLANGGNCSFSVNVTGTTGGVKNNSVTVTAAETQGGGSATASVTVVDPPSIAKAFNPTTIQPNGVSVLTFTITNPNAGVPAFGVAFTDVLPADLVVATPSGLTNTCGGTATATAGSSSISLSGGTVGAGSTCMVSVNVTTSVAGAYTNTSGAVSSTNGGTGNTATDNLIVPTNTPTFTPTSTPTNTPIATPTATPTNTPVPIGSTCSIASQCGTGFCVTGVCCDTACTDPSMRCNLAGQVGTCATTAAEAPTLTPCGMVIAAMLLTGVAGFALRQRMRGR